MAVPQIQPAFTTGEVSPSLFGRSDLARFHVGAATFRNGFVSYRGGYYSRAGTKFVGFSKQTGKTVPPRLIPFQFNINQGLALEFGDFYMRVIKGGAFVTETPIAIGGITQSNPAVVTMGIVGATSATVAAIGNNYAVGDTVTLAGGNFSVPAVLNITRTTLAQLNLNSPASSGFYAPGDTVALAGGTQVIQPQISVVSTTVISATIANSGNTFFTGVVVVRGTTGNSQFQAVLNIVAGLGAVSVASIILGGSYTVNPTNPQDESVLPVGPPILNGCALNLTMGIQQFTLTNPGVFTANPPGGNLTQASTSGSGSGASFIGTFGANAVSINTAGTYTSFPANPVHQALTSGSGSGATFNVMTSGSVPFSNGDWVSFANVGGMSQINGLTAIVGNIVGGTFQLLDPYGNGIDTSTYSAYTSGGTAARIYTLTTPYAAVDLPYLKFTQSADTMSLCLVNQATLTQYVAQDLVRQADNFWTITPLSVGTSAVAPTNATAVASSAGSTDYAYVVTSIANDGTESIASNIARVNSAVNIASTAGTITISWSANGSKAYNVYKATPGVSSIPPDNSLFGFIGTTKDSSFLDSNIVADFAQVPPTHSDPFQTGIITAAVPTNPGQNYTFVNFSVNTATGSGANFMGILRGGSLVAIQVLAGGSNYAATDTLQVTGDGTGATGVIRIGDFPGVATYFQQRRVYAATLDSPNTYFMSQPGAFKNFDSRLPTISTDAIIGTPWSLQVNGIQFMVPMPGGLVTLTGLAAWQLTGTGGSSLNPVAITPTSQDAQPQAYNGCSATLPPIRIDYDIIYVQSKNSIYRSFAYQYFTNIYTGVDLTINSSHLFTGFTSVEHAWCEEPYKILWSVRNDGALLSLTYLKPQEIVGWGRHDTNGLFLSTCSVTEPPVDALYVATQRFPNANNAYMIERMDNRLWSTAETCWCVDCGLALGQPTPAATLSASSATGLGSITGVTNLVGGQNYSAATTAQVVDDNGNGLGSGAVPTLTIVGGVITAVTFSGPNQGTNYTYPRLDISDPSGSGSGASATPVLNNSATFTASAPVFSAPNVGSVIRMGGGVATITSFVDSQHVVANITSPITQIITNSVGQPRSQTAGNWTMTAPVTQISGLLHIAGMTVTGLADGNVVTPRVVSPTGMVTLDQPASSVTLGLGFTAQLQSMYLDAGEPTVQGQRKKIAAVTARIESSRTFNIGTNQVDGSTLSPMQLAPTWNNLVPAPEKAKKPYNSNFQPLFTGDVRIPVEGGFATPGQVALQQSTPLPLQVLALINEEVPGDIPETGKQNG